MSHICPRTDCFHRWKEAPAAFTYVCPDCSEEVGTNATKGAGCRAFADRGGPAQACGQPVVRAHRCATCIEREVARLREDLAEHNEAMGLIRSHISELMGETVA
jgi:hypothetical protein